MSLERSKFACKVVNGVDTLYAHECSTRIVDEKCSECAKLWPIVDKAYHSPTNVKEGRCQGQMVKALHAHVCSQQISFSKKALDVFSKVVRDGPKKTFDSDRFALLNDKCRARLNYCKWLGGGGPVVDALLLRTQSGKKKLN